MNLDEAFEIADGLCLEMVDWCEQLVIAGSIRRKKAECKDIELVAIPKWVDGAITDMFGQTRERINVLHGGLVVHPRIQWIKPGVPDIVPWQIKPDGKYWRGIVDDKIKLDLFLATPENFGIIFLIRTGPAEFSQRFVTQKHKGGLLPNDYKVEGGHLKWLTGKPIDCPTEEEAFRIAGIPFIKPKDRK